MKGVGECLYSLIKGVDLGGCCIIKKDRVVAIGFEVCYNSVVFCGRQVDYDISKTKNRRVFVKLEIA